MFINKIMMYDAAVSFFLCWKKAQFSPPVVWNAVQRQSVVSPQMCIIVCVHHFVR